MQNYTTNPFHERTRTCREMRGQGIGRGRDSEEARDNLEMLLHERKSTLETCEKRWNTELTEEQKKSLLALRESWTNEKILQEHLNPYMADQKLRNRWDFIKYRIKKGDFDQDVPKELRKNKE